MSNNLNLKLTYNPYTYESEIAGIDLGENTKLEEFLNENRNKNLQVWYKELFNKLEEELNIKKFNFTFKGRDIDAVDIEEEIEKLNNSNWKINYSYEKTELDSNNIFSKLEEFVENIKENAPKRLISELKEKNAFQEFENSKNSEVSVSVIATMSSGKSTLINAILEEELLPSKNEACTATICQIKDIDEMEEFMVKVKDLEGNEIHEWQKASRDFLESVNEKGNEKGLNIYMEGNIPGICSKEMNLVIIDTPGPNNSQNQEHKAATYKYIKDNEANPLVLYVMNATQHATNDDNKLLTEIADIIKEKGKQAEERFLFALNKIDCFDTEKESVEKLIANNKEYLKSKGIKNPKIFPISAEFAKLKKLSLKNEKLTRAQSNNLNTFRNNFMPDLSDDYEGIDTIKYASISDKMKNELYKEAETDEDKAHLNYSGISSIEKYIDNYVSKYAKTQKIKDSISVMKQILDKNYKEIKMMYGKTIEEQEKTKKEIEIIEKKLSTQGQDKINKVKSEIKNIAVNEAPFDRLLEKVGSLFSNLEFEFRDSEATENQAIQKIEDAERELETLMIQIKTSLESTIKDEVKSKSDNIINELKKYFAEILKGEDIGIEVSSALASMFELEMPRTNQLINSARFDKSIYDGERVVGYESTSKWWNPFSWGSQREITEAVYRTETRVNLNGIYTRYIEPMSDNFRKPINENRENLRGRINILKEEGMDRIKEIENNIKIKIAEIKNKLGEVNKLESEKEQFKQEMEMIVSYKEKLDLLLKI